jgi:hypothetical protein
VLAAASFSTSADARSLPYPSMPPHVSKPRRISAVRVRVPWTQPARFIMVRWSPVQSLLRVSNRMFPHSRSEGK